MEADPPAPQPRKNVDLLAPQNMNMCTTRLTLAASSDQRNAETASIRIFKSSQTWDGISGHRRRKKPIKKSLVKDFHVLGRALKRGQRQNTFCTSTSCTGPSASPACRGLTYDMHCEPCSLPTEATAWPNNPCHGAASDKRIRNSQRQAATPPPLGISQNN